jgi:hypothetical protein
MALNLNTALRAAAFRRTAIVATTAVAMLFPAHAAFAQTAGPGPNSGAARPCRDLGPTDAGVKCAIRELDRRIDAANARAKAADERAAEAKKRGAAADRRGAAADREFACLELIMKDLEKSGEKTANLTAVPPKGQACETAKRLKLISG